MGEASACVLIWRKKEQTGDAQNRKCLKTREQMSSVLKCVDDGVASRQNLNMTAEMGKDTTWWTWDICSYNY